MKKMTKWLAVCAVCVMGSVPAMAAEVPDVTGSGCNTNRDTCTNTHTGGEKWLV